MRTWWWWWWMRWSWWWRLWSRRRRRGPRETAEGPGPRGRAYDAGSRWVGLGRSVGLGGLTLCFFPAGRRGLGSFWGRVARVVCRAAWLLFTGVHAPCVVSCVRCPGPPGSCSPVCTPCVWCRVYGVLGLPAPVHRCARPACGVACTASWATRPLFTGAHALRVALRVRRPGPPGSCSPACTLCVWCCVYGVLGLPAPVHRCARPACGVACTASWASRLLFTGAHALRVALRVRRPGPPGSCSPVCTLRVWCRVYGVLGLPAPVHRCARPACGVACTASWASRLLFTGVHALRVVSCVRCPGPPGSCSPVCTPCVWCRVYGVLGLPAPVHRCARSACGVACTASWASRLLFTGVHALRVVLRVRRPGPPGSCSPVCTPCVWRRVYGVLGLPAPVHRCARPACGVVCTVSWASRLLFTGVHALRVVSRVRRPGPPGSWSPVCTPCVWCRVYGVLGTPAPVHRCARSACGVACTASWASRLLFTGVHALRVVLRVRRPGPPGSCSPVCTPCVWCRVYGVLGLPAPVHRCARSACGVACTASWASRLLFTGVHALRVVSCVRCPGPPGSCSPVCTPCVRCRVYGVLGLPAPVHRCARLVCGVACTVSWASRLLFTGVQALCVVLCVRCPGPPGSCSPVRTLCVWRCVYGVLGLPAPVHRCARSACGVACTASWASRLLFTGVHALRVVLRVRRPGPPGSCSPVCTPCVWRRVYGVLGLPAPVHRCARPACGVVCTVSWASRLLFTGVHALRVVSRVRRPGPPGSWSPVCTPCVWCRVYGVLGLPAPVHRCARSACGVACTASWASRLLFTGVHALRVVLRVRRPGPPGSCSPVCTPCVWCRVYGVLGLPAPVHRCARSACGVACTASWASRLLFTGVHALRVVSCVRCPGPPGSCSPVCTPCVRCRVYGVLGLPAPVHRCARLVCGVACTVSWASRLLFTGGHALCVVLCVRCPGPPGSCSPVRTLCVWRCVYGVLGLPAPVHRCARSVCGVACTASWASRLLFAGAHALRVVLRVRRPGPPGSCLPVCMRLGGLPTRVSFKCHNTGVRNSVTAKCVHVYHGPPESPRSCVRTWQTPEGKELTVLTAGTPAHSSNNRATTQLWGSVQKPGRCCVFLESVYAKCTSAGSLLWDPTHRSLKHQMMLHAHPKSRNLFFSHCKRFCNSVKNSLVHPLFVVSKPQNRSMRRLDPRTSGHSCISHSETSYELVVAHNGLTVCIVAYCGVCFARRTTLVPQYRVC